MCKVRAPPPDQRIHKQPGHRLSLPLISGFLASYDAKKQEMKETMTTSQAPLHVEDQLATHNLLNLEILKSAVVAGQQALAACSLDRPPMARGVHVWGVILETLRILGRRVMGWARSEAKLSSVLSPDGNTQIVVATGDEATGVEGAVPRTKYPRGAASIEAIEGNQMCLFPNIAPFKKPTAKPGALTWILLHRRKKEEVVWEISLPKAVDTDGIIQSWETRIILPPLAVEPLDEELMRGLDLDDAAEQFDPIVTRKRDDEKPN
ncbi:MAG TPA: hypothetical protein VFO89_06920 [Thermoanaerobaculia bacterium]|nr:hypothetical protein [Thermoanaerobaculia bacterium]